MVDSFAGGQLMGCRVCMEDYYVLYPCRAGGLFAAVYDGHRSDEVSRRLSRDFHLSFDKRLDELGAADLALRETYAEFDRILADSDAGSTAVTIHVDRDVLTWAHVGDCRALLVSSRLRPLTRDHRLNDPAELKRVVSLGAEIDPPYVMKGLNGLMPTRSFGDAEFRSIGITAKPDIGSLDLTPSDHWIVLGSDGLFDVIDEKEFPVVLAAKSEAKSAVDSILDKIRPRDPGDNVTAVVIRI